MSKFFTLPGAPEKNSPKLHQFGENSLFNTHQFGTYLTDNINFITIAELIKTSIDVNFDYTEYIGFRTVTYTRAIGAGIDSKFDRIMGNTSIEQKTIATTIPIQDNEKILTLKGRLNHGEATIALNPNTNSIGVGGLELVLDLSNYSIYFHFHIYYKDKTRVFLRNDDGTHIAISITTTNFQDFVLLGEHTKKNLLTNEFQNDIRSQFEIAFEKANNNYKYLSWLYEVAPHFIIQERGNRQLYLDFEFILSGMSVTFKVSYWTNQNQSILNILNAMSPAFLYEELQRDQSILFEILNRLDSEYDLPFVQFIANLCIDNWTQNDLENGASVLVGKVNTQTEFYINRFTPSIDITGQILQENRVNFQNIHGVINRIGYEGTIEVINHHLEPLQPLWVRTTSKQNFWIPAIVLEPFIQKAERGSNIKFYTDIIFVIATLNALTVLKSTTYPVFLRLLAAIEVAKAPIDLVMELRYIQIALSRTEEGKWFIEHWSQISLALDISTLSFELLYNLVKNGPKVVTLFRRKKKEDAAKNLEEVIVQVEKHLTDIDLKKIREKLFKEASKDGYKYYEIRFLTKNEIRNFFGKAGIKLEYQVSKQVEKIITEAKKLHPKFKKNSLTIKAKNWLFQRQLVAGVTHQNFDNIIVLKTNYPKNLLNKFLKKSKISRNSPNIESVQKIYRFFKEKGFIKYTMHERIKERIIWHIEELQKGIKKSENYDWERTGGIPGIHAEILAINDLLWEIEKINGFKLSNNIFEELIAYNLNLKYNSVMIRCGDCQLLTYDVPFIEKTLKSID